MDCMSVPPLFDVILGSVLISSFVCSGIVCSENGLQHCMEIDIECKEKTIVSHTFVT